eukprot:6183196-Pleurochrysis_carterae.AAC.1
MSAARPDSSLPSAARPDMSLPSAARPDSSHPSAARPDSSHPSAARPDSSLPSAARSDSSLPSQATRLRARQGPTHYFRARLGPTRHFRARLGPSRHLRARLGLSLLQVLPSMLRCFLHDLSLPGPIVAVVLFEVIPTSVLTGALPITVDETLRLGVARTNRLPLDTHVLNTTRGKASILLHSSSTRDASRPPRRSPPRRLPSRRSPPRRSPPRRWRSPPGPPPPRRSPSPPSVRGRPPLRAHISAMGAGPSSSATVFTVRDEREQLKERPQSVQAPAASRFPTWPQRARQQLLRFAPNPVIYVARPAGPCNGIEFSKQLYNFICCPSQSYKGSKFDGEKGAETMLLARHTAADRSLFRDLSCSLHCLGYGRKGGKVRFNADSPVLVEPFHHAIRERLPTAALPALDDVWPAPLRSVDDTGSAAAFAIRSRNHPVLP